jgi:hypothetical protein
MTTARKRRLALTVGALAFAIAASFVIAVKFAGFGAEGPRAVPESNIFDFGESDTETDVECLFRIHNRGQADLVLGEVRTNCRCTPASWDMTKVSPGDSASLRIGYRTPNHGAEVRERVVVETNDLSRRYLLLHIAGRVSPRLQIVPEVLDFGRLVASNGGDIPVRFAALCGWTQAAHFGVDELEESEDWLAASFELARGQAPVLGRLRVSITKTPPFGASHGQVIVKARSGETSYVRILDVLVDVVKSPAGQ